MVDIKRGKSALIVEGGAMRGVFAAGVLNAFGSRGFDPFDIYIGVSAGACNLASHLAGQNERNFDIIKRYSSSPRFISFGRFLRGGHLMDLDWLWEITIREYRLDLKNIFDGLRKQDKEYIIVATSMETGQGVYLQPNETTLEHDLKVSSSLPIFYRNILEIKSEKVTDGGVADSLPVAEACRRGATDITVVRTRPSEYVKKMSRLSFLYPLMFRKYPQFALAMKNRPVAYMESVQLIKNPPAGVRISEIAPPPGIPPGRMTTSMKILTAAYQSGREHGKRFVDAYETTKIGPE
ncbi:MAG: patatin family protein [Deltaproteobacteria bacterium HGW-Deltaproteobacteria-13]|jgi:predicted patatin/cPLA2 family phospholipase|nr:MAG: patatin family protein [Deltaproteobacteria bacterium HGW-Deltaproteobacteria-13]